MKIAIACDHGGYLLKQDILIWLEEHDIDYEDFGCYSPRAWTIPCSRKRPPAPWPTAPVRRAS